MKNQLLKLIKKSCKNDLFMDRIDSIYTLYEELQYAETLEEMADILYNWLITHYNIDNINFSLFNSEQNSNTIILKKGEDFFLDGEFSFYFVINTHTEINAVVSFSASSKEQYDKITKQKDIIDIAFFQISPILQNGIIKKYHIEASSLDSVTNVYNRQYLIEHINKLLSLSHKKDKSIVFLMIGIDRFKAVIDEFDYDIGDRVLIELAKVIHRNIKDFDIVARLTGDEFLVALIDISLDKAIQKAQKIIEQFASTNIIIDDLTGQILRKTISIGISSYPTDSSEITQVIKNADSALYEAKNLGRGKYIVYKKEEISSIELF